MTIKRSEVALIESVMAQVAQPADTTTGWSLSHLASVASLIVYVYEEARKRLINKEAGYEKSLQQA